MSAATVRQGIRDFLTAAHIQGLAKVYLDAPWRVLGPKFAIGTAGNFGAVAWPHLDEQHERRVTFPAGTGSKEVTYRVGLLIVFQYRIPTDLGGADEDAWVGPHDAMLDAIVARLRSDQKLGTGPSGAIFQAGEGTDNQLTIKRDLPKLDGGTLHVWTAVEFDVTEIVTA